jgi:hypothetical protein
LWSAEGFKLTAPEIDLPYKEIAAELMDPQSAVIQHQRAPDPAVESKRQAKDKVEARMAEADAAIMAAMGLTGEDDS